jgi:hypothetical protein
LTVGERSLKGEVPSSIRRRLGPSGVQPALGRLLSSVDSCPSCGTNPQPSMCAFSHAPKRIDYNPEKAVLLRKSTRSNIGVQPTRFGNPVSSSRRTPTRKPHLQEVMSANQNASAPNLDDLINEPSQRQGVNEDNGSIYSRRSIGSAVSVSFSIRKLSKKIQVQESIMELKNKRMNLQKEKRIMEGELK